MIRESGPCPAVLSTYSRLCAHGLLLVVLGGPYKAQRMKLELTTCKTSPFTFIFSALPHPHYLSQIPGRHLD